jgi:hypothetical protein
MRTEREYVLNEISLFVNQRIVIQLDFVKESKTQKVDEGLNFFLGRTLLMRFDFEFGFSGGLEATVWLNPKFRKYFKVKESDLLEHIKTNYTGQEDNAVQIG